MRIASGSLELAVWPPASLPPVEVSTACEGPTSPPVCVSNGAPLAPPVTKTFDIRWSMPSATSLAGSPLVRACVSSGLRLKPRSAFAGSLRSWLRNAASLIARCTTSLSFVIRTLLPPLRSGVLGSLRRSAHPLEQTRHASFVNWATVPALPASPSCFATPRIVRPSDRKGNSLLKKEQPPGSGGCSELRRGLLGRDLVRVGSAGIRRVTAVVRLAGGVEVLDGVRVLRGQRDDRRVGGVAEDRQAVGGVVRLVGDERAGAVVAARYEI